MNETTRIIVLATPEAELEALERLEQEPDFEVDVLTERPNEIVDCEVLILDDALDDEILSRLSGTFTGVVLLLADSYSPQALKRTIKLDVDAFVQKGVRSSEIVRIVRQELKRSPSERADARDEAREIVGSSEPMHDLLRLLSRAAPSELPVLITGESGTGKELVARAIHRLSPRRHGPFQAVNCGAFPENLIESETRKVHSPAPTDSARACSKPPTMARSFSTRSASFHS